MRTYQPRGDVADSLQAGPNWFVIDATNQVLGRLATRIARLLIGKDKPSFTPHLDCGDHVVVVNANKIRLTGNKLEQKNLPASQRISRRIEGSSGKALASEPRGLDGSRGRARHVA
jgi:ribosomal protein L13